MSCKGLQKCQRKLHGLLASLFEKWAIIITSGRRSLLIFIFTLLTLLSMGSFYRLSDKYGLLDAPWVPEVSGFALYFR